MMRNWLHFISLAAAMFFGLESAAAADTFRIRLTGPVAIQGAEPGDLLVVHIVDILQDDFAYTINVPGFGFLRSEVPGPAILHWDIKGDVATSRDLPGVRIHAEPSMGTTGIALSVAKTEEVYQREHELAGRGGFVLEPLEADAVPASVCGHGGTFASRCLRTIPTRENAGNIDVKQLTKGGRLLIPVFVPGALFSAGDAHFAQGDGEIAGTTMEMNVPWSSSFPFAKARLSGWASPLSSLSGTTSSHRPSERCRSASLPRRAFPWIASLEKTRVKI